MAEPAEYRLEILAALAATVADRRGAEPQSSYTAKLLSEGVEKCAKKLGEEAVEAALAAVKGDNVHLTFEAADVLYHLIVLLEARGVALAEVMAVLEARMGISGLNEKAARKRV